MTSRQVIPIQKSQYFIHHQAFGVARLPRQGEALLLSSTVSSCANLDGLCAVIHVTALAQKTSKHFSSASNKLPGTAKEVKNYSSE